MDPMDISIFDSDEDDFEDYIIQRLISKYEASDESDEESSVEDVFIQTQPNRPVQNTFKDLQQTNKNINNVKLNIDVNKQSTSTVKSKKITVEEQEFTEDHEKEDSLRNFFFAMYKATKEMPTHVQSKIKKKVSTIIDEEKVLNKNSSEDSTLPNSIKIEEPSLDEYSAGNEPYPEFVQKFETFVEKDEPL